MSKKKGILGLLSTPGNLDPSDPSKVMCITTEVHTKRNSSVQATFILTQIISTALPLFKEHLQQSHYLQKQYCSER